MTDTPQLLLAHHLKALRLPTFLREYDKLARPSDQWCGLVQSADLLFQQRQIVDRIKDQVFAVRGIPIQGGRSYFPVHVPPRLAFYTSTSSLERKEIKRLNHREG